MSTINAAVENLAKGIVELTAKITASQAQIAPLESERQQLQAYRRLVISEKTKRSAEIVTKHELWVRGELRRIERTLEPTKAQIALTEKRLTALQNQHNLLVAENERREKESFERMKAHLEAKPVASAIELPSLDRKPPERHTRRYVAKGERPKQKRSAKPEKREKSQKARRGGQREIREDEAA